MTTPRPFKLIDFSIPKNLQALQLMLKRVKNCSDTGIKSYSVFNGSILIIHKFKLSTWRHTLWYIKQNYPEYFL